MASRPLSGGAAADSAGEPERLRAAVAALLDGEAQASARELQQGLSRLLTSGVVLPRGCTPDDFLARLPNGSEARLCGRVFSDGEIAYNCNTCGADPTCVMCMPCFNASNHEGHDVSFHRTAAGGCCDCGDPEAWNPAGFCTKHKGASEDDDYEPTEALPEQLRESGARVLRAVTSWIENTVLAGARSFDLSRAESLAKSEEVRPKRSKKKLQWSLVVHNDDVHTYQEVTSALVSDVSMTADRAAVLTAAVDREGMATVRAAARFRGLLAIAQRLQRRGLQVSLRPSWLVRATKRLPIVVKWVESIVSRSDGLARLVGDCFVEETTEPDAVDAGSLGLSEDGGGDARLDVAADSTGALDDLDAESDGGEDPPSSDAGSAGPPAAAGLSSTLLSQLLGMLPQTGDNEGLLGELLASVGGTTNLGSVLAQLQGGVPGDDSSEASASDEQGADVEGPDGVELNLDASAAAAYGVGGGDGGDFSAGSFQEGAHMSVTASTDGESEDAVSVPSVRRSVSDFAEPVAAGTDPSAVEVVGTSSTQLSSEARKMILSLLLVEDARLTKEVAEAMHALYMRLLPDLKFRRLFATAFAVTYKDRARQWCHGVGPAEQSVLDFSVQLLTVPSIVQRLTMENGLMFTLLTALQENLSSALDERGVINLSHKIILHRRFIPILRDITYALRVDGIASVVLAEEPLLRRLLRILAMLHWADPRKRKRGEHVLFDNNMWIHAFTVSHHFSGLAGSMARAAVSSEATARVGTSSIASSAAAGGTGGAGSGVTAPKPSEPRWVSVIAECCRQINSAVRRAAALDRHHWVIRTVDVRWLPRFESPQFDVASHQVSFHIPVHRFVGLLCRRLAVSLGIDIATLFEVVPMEQRLQLGDLPLRVMVLAAQVRAKMWRRNGQSLTQELLNYESGPQSAYFGDMDMSTLQLALALLSAEHALGLVLDRFKCIEWFLIHSPVLGSTPAAAAAHALLAEECLRVLIWLVTELPPRSFELHEGGAASAEAAVVRRQVVQHLAVRPRPFSELRKLIRSNLADFSETTPPSTIERALQDVAIRRDAPGGEGASFHLKGSAWVEFDPMYYRLNPKDLQAARERWQTARKAERLAAGPGVDLPPRAPVAPPPAANAAYSRVRDMLHTTQSAALFRGILRDFATNDSTRFSTSVLAAGLHWFALAVHCWTPRVSDEFVAALVDEEATASTESGSVVSLLAHLASTDHPDLAEHQESARWALSALAEKSEVLATAVRTATSSAIAEDAEAETGTGASATPVDDAGGPKKEKGKKKKKKKKALNAAEKKAKREAKIAAAKKKAMANIASKQSLFLEKHSFEDEAGGSEHADGEDADASGLPFEEPSKCIMCHADAPDRPLGYLGWVERSAVWLPPQDTEPAAKRRHKESDVRAGTSASADDGAGDGKEETAPSERTTTDSDATAPVIAKPVLSGDMSVGGAGVAVQFCGHVLHHSCAQKYWSGVLDESVAARQFDGEMAFAPRWGEFTCPFCRSATNLLAPHSASTWEDRIRVGADGRAEAEPVATDSPLGAAAAAAVRDMLASSDVDGVDHLPGPCVDVSMDSGAMTEPTVAVADGAALPRALSVGAAASSLHIDTVERARVALCGRLRHAPSFCFPTTPVKSLWRHVDQEMQLDMARTLSTRVADVWYGSAWNGDFTNDDAWCDAVVAAAGVAAYTVTAGMNVVTLEARDGGSRSVRTEVAAGGAGGASSGAAAAPDAHAVEASPLASLDRAPALPTVVATAARELVRSREASESKSNIVRVIATPLAFLLSGERARYVSAADDADGPTSEVPRGASSVRLAAFLCGSGVGSQVVASDGREIDATALGDGDVLQAHLLNTDPARVLSLLAAVAPTLADLDAGVAILSVAVVVRVLLQLAFASMDAEHDASGRRQPVPETRGLISLLAAALRGAGVSPPLVHRACSCVVSAHGDDNGLRSVVERKASVVLGTLGLIQRMCGRRHPGHTAPDAPIDSYARDLVASLSDSLVGSPAGEHSLAFTLGQTFFADAECPPRRWRVLLPHLTCVGEMANLVRLPSQFNEFYAMVTETLGPRVAEADGDPTMCLICGQCLVAGEKVAGVGACHRHARNCGRGVGIFLLASTTQVLLIRGRWSAYYASPYVDKWGEQDVGLRRGGLLALSAARMKKLERLWRCHLVGKEVVRLRISLDRLIRMNYY